MEFQKRYIKKKAKLLNDSSICDENRQLFKLFFKKEEEKLPKYNDIPKLDNGCYKTLYGYILKFYNVNNWFDNKPWKELSKTDIKKVFDALDNGEIKKKGGTPFKDRPSYYHKIFKSKPFQLAGKREIVEELLEYKIKKKPRDVRFIEENVFRKMVDVAISPQHKLLMWLGFDIGENNGALVQLRKKDFIVHQNKYTKEKEYHIVLRKEILKRSRKPRTEPTNFVETVNYADIVLQKIKDDDSLVFNFGQRQAEKILNRCVEITKARCQPNGEKVQWKDLRSSMACYLLNHDWTLEEINARLGHRPSSTEIDVYINFFALKREKPKKKLTDSNYGEVLQQLEEMRHREKLYIQRIENMRSDIESIKVILRDKAKEEILKNRPKKVQHNHVLK